MTRLLHPIASRIQDLLAGAPLGVIGLATFIVGGGVYVLAAYVSPAVALGATAAAITVGAALTVHAIAHRVDIASGQIAARLTLDQLQQGVNDWRLATAFSAPPELLLRAFRELATGRPRTLVELGAGASTLVLARIIHRQRLSCRLVAVEHDSDYLAAIAQEVELEGLAEHVTLLHAPLEPLAIDGYDGLWYRREEILKETSAVDVLIIDGPPKKHGADIRFPAVPIFANHLSPGALVLLDDARRGPERRSLDRWARMFPQAQVSFDPAGYGIGTIRWADERSE